MNEQVYFIPDGETGPYFIPAYWREDGTYNDESWPVSAVLMTDDEVATYWKLAAPEGKQLGSDAGRPAWVNVPPLTPEQQIELAKQKKTTLKAEADSEISWRKDAVDEGMATEAESAALTSWTKYRVLLMRIDTSLPDDIAWPDKPE